MINPMSISYLAVLCVLSIPVIISSSSTSTTAHASPILVPDLQQCAMATDMSVVGPVTIVQLNCCLPIPANQAIDFSFDAFPVTRTHNRRPAQNASAKYIAKYIRAYELMRALPADDPRSMAMQASLHCAFCNGAYMQAGTNQSVPLQVHFSWLFLPWHRWYLYFHERILGSLLGDPGFALVYWNWDDQRSGGNVMPGMFAQNGTALYDAKRNQANLPPTLVKLSPGESSTDTNSIANSNLNAMYQSIVTANSAELFMGGAYRTGTDLTNSTVLNAPLGGSIENSIHNGVHFWTGDPLQPLIEDMGTFTTASRDPIFFAHHSNIDRLWEIWRTGLPDGPRDVHSDADFLDAQFYFYDENATLVRVTVRGALNNSKLGVSYKKVRSDNLWIKYEPPAVTNSSTVLAARASGVPEIGAVPQNNTVALGEQLVGIVKRPEGKKPKKKQEVLVIQGLQVTRDNFVAVIVFVNMPTANASTATSSAEYVGTFNIIPSASKHRNLTTNVKFEIGDNLKRIGIAHDEQVVITLAVKGTQPITIQGLLLDYE